MVEVCFRADADFAIGYGHVVRSAALAGTLRQRHTLQSLLWTRTPVAFELGMQQRQIPSDVTAEAEAAWIADQSDRPSVVILDLWRPPAAQLAGYERCRPWKLVCFNDECEIDIACDILLNPSLKGDHSHRVRQAARCLVGASFLPMRNGFELLPTREIRPLPAELLVCFGGSDALNLSGRVVSAWSRNWPSGIERATLVVGPGYLYEEALRESAQADPRWRIERAVTNMVDLMRSADLGLFTASALLYEALAAGLPALFVSVTAGQRKEAEEAARLGVAVDLGFAGDFDESRLGDGISRLLTSNRESVSRRAQALVDGLGCQRIADAIATLVAANASTVINLSEVHR